MKIDRAKLASLAALWRLSPRELDVLLAIIEGADTDQQVAERLAIAAGTAKTHVRSILYKSGCASKVALLAKIICEL